MTQEGVPDSYISPSTDLALEATEVLYQNQRQDIPGVTVQEEKHEGITITRVNIWSEIGERMMGKAQGNYITIEAPGLRRRNWELQQSVGLMCTKEISALLLANGALPQSFLVVGLGNWRATPDSLGPRVVRHILVTRHLKDYVPEDLKGKLRGVSAVAPGVLGITGIETGEIVRGIVEKTAPQAVIAIDALAARSVDRIATTVQIADTGIHPGSGVGNKRPGLTRETLGVPVIAIGIPTVVHALTIAENAISALSRSPSIPANVAAGMASMGDTSIRQVLSQASESLNDLVVTPKEIDTYISDMGKIVASALNDTFHPDIDTSEFTRFL